MKVTGPTQRVVSIGEAGADTARVMCVFYVCVCVLCICVVTGKKVLDGERIANDAEVGEGGKTRAEARNLGLNCWTREGESENKIWGVFQELQ